MGSDRSVRAVARALNKSATIVGRWSSQNDWVARVQAMADYHEMIRREAIEEHERAGAEEEARIQHEIRMELLKGGLKAAKRQNEILDSPLYREREEVRDDGTVVVFKEPARWTFDTAKKMYEMGALAAGEVTSRTETRGAEANIEYADNPAAEAALDAFLDAVTGGEGEADGPGSIGRSELE